MFAARDFLIGVLEDARSEHQSVFRVQSKRNGHIDVSLHNDTFVADPKSLSAFCQLPRQDFSIVALNAAESNHAQVALGRPLDELYWQVAYWACNGQLPEGCFQFDMIQLVRWPNFTRLPYDDNFMRICALLARSQRSVMLAARILKISEAEMQRFYCAALHSKAIKITNRRSAAANAATEAVEAIDIPAPHPPKNAGLLGKLFRRLTGM